MGSQNIVLPSVSTIRAEMHTILRALNTLSITSNDVKYVYSKSDLIEALQIAERIILDRLADGIDDWKDDSKIPSLKKISKENRHLLPFRSSLGLDLKYGRICQSIEDQIKETIKLYFSDNGKTHHFVTTFNNLFVERLITWIQMMGPSAEMNNIVSFIVGDMVEYLSEDEDFESEKEAFLALSQVRSNDLKKQLSKNNEKMLTRLDIIQQKFEKLRNNTSV